MDKAKHLARLASLPPDVMVIVLGELLDKLDFTYRDEKCEQAKTSWQEGYQAGLLRAEEHAKYVRRIERRANPTREWPRLHARNLLPAAGR